MEDNRQMQAAGASVTDTRSSPALRAFAANVSERFRRMDARQRAWLLAAIGCAVVCFAGLLWYGMRTDWRVLYAGLEPDDARLMASELTAASIPFDVSPDGGTLRVPAPDLDKARLTTTAKGGPKSGRMGFELFDKPNWIGSDFDEKVNYQRALEGELEHTINTLSAVESSRVHLVMPHDSLFTDQQRAAKASVVLRLRHSSLSSDEAESIRNLVASAVDDLRPENVALMDTDGRSLDKKTGDAATEQHEQELADKLIETLEPVAGAGNVRASVNVEYDTSSADETDETYDPANVVTLSMQRTDQTSGGQPVAAGVPGTTSNAPNVKPPLYPQQTTGVQSLKQESGTYGASKRVLHKVQGPGKIRRITAAILINDRMDVNGKKVSWRPRTPQEMKNIDQLAQAAIGFDASRGDQVSVENIAFEDNGGLPPESIGERVRREAADWTPLLKYGVILLAMLGLFLVVIRPVMRNLALAPGSTGALSSGAYGPLPHAGAPLELTMEELAAEKQKQHAQTVFENVAEQLRREPGQTSRLLQSWIHSE